MLIKPGRIILPVRETLSVFGGRGDFERIAVFPIATIRQPITRIAPSRMISRSGLMVIIVAFV